MQLPKRLQYSKKHIDIPWLLFIITVTIIFHMTFFYGTSENAVKSQIWIAVSVYVLVAIMKKRLQLQESLYTML